MNLTQSIQDLLYEHECVVIPQFGGFITNYKPAFTHPKKQSIFPPSKQVSFNVNLKNNDGLVANYISQKEGVSYEVALNYVKSTVNEFSETLSKTRRLELVGIGILSKSNQGVIEFSPDNSMNFLRDSFGLNPVFLPTISELTGSIEEEEIKEESYSPKETKVIPIETSQPQEEKTEVKKPQRKWLAAAMFLPLMFVGGMTFHKHEAQIFSFVGQLAPSNSSHVKSNFNPRIEGEKLAFTYENSTPELEVIISQNPELQSVYYSFEQQEISPDGIKVEINGRSSSVTPIASRTNSETSNSSVSSASKLGLYFTVAGAFGEKSNADKLVKKLQAKGYDSAIFGKKGQLHMVCYGSYTNKAAAKEALLKIQSSENSQAWLKKH